MPKITTNNHKRRLYFLDELSESDRAQAVDDAGEYDDTLYFKYRECWYSLADFTRIDHPYWGLTNSPLGKELLSKGWDGIYNDTYFSAILTKTSVDDNTGLPRVVVGTLYS